MTKPIDKAEVVLTIAAVWLAARGVEPSEIGARAQGIAVAFETMREKLEALAIRQVRTAVHCRAPSPCLCLVCTSYEPRKEHLS